MVDQAGELPDQFLDAALVRYERIEVASSHVAKAVALELADAILMNGDLDPEQVQRFAAVAGKLVDIIGLSRELLADIVDVTGIQADLGDGTIIHSPRELPDQPQPALLTPPNPAQPSADESATDSTTPHTDTGEASSPQPDTSASPKSTKRHRTKDSAGSSETEASVSDLYTAIVDPATTPKMQVDESKKSILSICADNEIAFGETKVPIKAHHLFLFNALLKLRDEPRTADEIKALGFHPDAGSEGGRTTVFNTQIGMLIKKVNEAAGREVFKKIERDGSIWFVVNPNIVLEDLREQTPDSLAETGAVVKKK